MSYGIRMLYPNGDTEEMDDVFDTKEEAEETGSYYCGCYKDGGEILNMSNPGDYPMEEVGGECNYEVFEIE